MKRVLGIVTYTFSFVKNRIQIVTGELRESRTTYMCEAENREEMDRSVSILRSDLDPPSQIICSVLLNH